MTVPNYIVQYFDDRWRHHAIVYLIKHLIPNQSVLRFTESITCPNLLLYANVYLAYLHHLVFTYSFNYLDY